MASAELQEHDATRRRYGEDFDLNVADNRRRSKTWWQAQCAFRDLSTSGSIQHLQWRLEDRDEEEDLRLHGQLQAREKAKIEKHWMTAATNEWKAAHDPTRFLRETFHGEDQSKLTHVLLKIENSNVRGEIHEACDALELQHESFNVPRSLTHRDDYYTTRWDVVGTDRSTVLEKINELLRQGRKEEAEAKASVEKMNQQQHAAIFESAKVRFEWDITGTWRVRSNFLEKYTGHDRSLTLNIFQAQQQEGHEYEAEFDFDVITGVMRISSLQGSNNDPDRSTAYRFRGRETGEGEIQLHSDEKLLPLTFSDHGTSLQGAFEAPCLERSDITGWKISENSGESRSGGICWESYSEDEYNYARTARWG